MRRLPVLLVAAASGVVGCLPIHAQTYEVIHAFSIDDGSSPLGTLLRVGTDFYGTTDLGGDTSGLCSSGCGTAFRIDSSLTLTTLHAFDSSTEGFLPHSGLIDGGDGNEYGTTTDGGAAGDGTVYRMDSNGTVSTVYDFDRDSGGWFAQAPLILGGDGRLYGTALYGPCDDMSDNCGIVFRLTLAGDLTTLHTFDPDEGSVPLSPLLQTSSEDFFGTTSTGSGAASFGRVFHMSGSGTVTTVHAFDSDDGNLPIGALVQDAAGNIYGVTLGGGGSGAGTIYRIDPLGNFTSLHSFDGTDGSFPRSGLVLASDGNFYGTTELGGQFGFGTLYRMDSTGAVVSLHDFDGTSGDIVNHPDGAAVPTAELVEGADGMLYGARSRGGAAGFLYRFGPALSAPLFCPNSFVRRDQMAVFLLKTEHGSSYTPPDCVGVFGDVACPSLFGDWIENLAAEGVTAGCGGGDYCPLSPVTREQMAVFLLKTEHGPAFTPPSCSGVFPDVPCTSAFAAWVEDLAAEGITAGCGGGNFCPGIPVTRAQMAVFLLKIEHGSAHVPPACAGIFGDVACPSLFAGWIEELFAEGITAGCR